MLTQLNDRRALRRWKRLAQSVDTIDVAELKSLRTRARSLGRRVNRVLQVADARLQLPVAGNAAIRRPLHSDWAWRPDIWSLPVSPPGLAAVTSKTNIGGEAKVFHDCQLNELTVRQIRNTRVEDIAPYGLRMDVFRFDGSFLSLVLDLPQAAVENLSRRHIIRLDIRAETESSLEIFGRLNIRHGPNVEQIVREFDLKSEEKTVEFDIAASRLNEKRVDRAWVDLIFEGPNMNQITLSDVTLTRRPRAEV
ncbi:MAG: hypothetical protein GKR98_02745 [Boseongicola sp.]|nr:MAG: hypothetical protein GKR98_02745 [Boseongicola sp.]